MEIRKATQEDFEELISLLKEAFPVHVVFTRSDKEILEYLENFEGEGLLAVEDDKIIGGLGISRKQYGHIVAFFKHIFAKDNDKEVIKALVKEAEKIADAAKIELHIAEGEKIDHTFYEELGYEVEGKLKSHYRQGEICYILGKEVQ
ncbi:GNAT family N-acetyltransferase [Candidatus Woesearchaeota archaeon]|nr:GNAT family N-acetyltransferase [Candidatus Woesearchaeota archaeon]